MSKKIHRILLKNYKKILLGVLVCTLPFICFMIRPIQAYLEDRQEIINTLIVGKNEIMVEEPFEEPQKGKKTVKAPSARNTGTVDCYVRAKVVASDSRALDYLRYYSGNVSGFHTSDWKAEEDGWMYYRTVLAVGAVTSPIFTHIELSNAIPDSLLGFTIDVLFESVQTEHFF